VIGCEAISTELAGFPGVHIDNRAAALEATRYLLGQGHRKIAFIYGQTDSLLTADREQGYRAAMQEANIRIEAGWVAEGKLTIDGAIQATQGLLDHHHRPTAIFCANDEMAMGCIHAIKSARLKVPEDVSVIGFDDIRYARICDPPLTTVFQPAEEIGRRVMYQLLDEIEQGRSGEAPAEIVPHRLIIRQSVTSLSG